MKNITVACVALGVSFQVLGCGSASPIPTPEESGSCGGDATRAPGDVHTRTGWIRGVTREGVRAYLGVPYAQPPTGAHRWKPPRPLTCHGDETMPTKAFGPACAQMDFFGNVTGQEDCLTLNVWTPEATSEQALPVVVFLHGGGNVNGSSSDTDPTTGTPRYEGSTLARDHGVVVVTLNYRLGAFGFLALQEFEGEGSGNFALLDQLEGLRWVREHIERFGGDPENVTLVGHSSGALDACVLKASPLAEGLFGKAILQSGTPCEAAELDGTQLAHGEAVDAIEACQGSEDKQGCLRSLSTDEILAVMRPAPVAIPGLPMMPTSGPTFVFGPVVDGEVLTATPAEVFGGGGGVEGAVLVGVTSEEMNNPFLPVAAETEEEARAFIVSMAEAMEVASPAEVGAAYDLDAHETPEGMVFAAWSDVVTVCPAAQAAQALSGHGVWRYVFSRRARVGDVVSPASHGAELGYIFGTMEGASDRDEELGRTMRSAWVEFMRQGTPGSPEGVTWPEFANGGAYIDFGDTTVTTQGWAGGRCAVWGFEG